MAGSSNRVNHHHRWWKKKSRRELAVGGAYAAVAAALLFWALLLLSAFSGAKPFVSLTTWLSLLSSSPANFSSSSSSSSSPPPTHHNLTSNPRHNQEHAIVSAAPPPLHFVKEGNGNSTTSVAANANNFNNNNKPNAAAAVAAVAPPPPSASVHRDMLTRPIWDVPPGTRMPDVKAFQLTKKMVQHRAKNNVIIVTFGNYAFMPFIVNWVKHLTDINITNLLTGAMDTKTLEALYWKGIPVFDMGSNIATVDVGWGSPIFYQMGREKVFLVNAFLHLGFELLMCDTDMVWLKNPLPYFTHFPEADILISTDNLAPTQTDDSLEVRQGVKAAYNIGIFYWRPTDPAKRLAKEWKDELLKDEKLWDQFAFNKLVLMDIGSSIEEESELFYAYDGRLKMGLLPSSIFCSGHTYFVQAQPQQLKLEPYAVHATFQFAGTEGKRHRLREAMLFHDEPEYYDSPGGFLSFMPRIPKSLLLEGPRTIESHFALVNYQLKQIRTALAFALLLNRTLIMPPVWCKIDLGPGAPPGIYENTMVPLPFLCPLDHTFEVNVMLSALPDIDFGPKIEFREYSFLQNPRLPKQIKESVLEVQICGNRKCIATNETTEQGVLRFPKNSNQEMIQQVFSKYKDVKVLQFSTMKDAFGGFTDKMMETKFRNRVKRYAGTWCCVKDRRPGHIFYDMYWDEKPNWKPEPPKSEADDQPPW